MLWGDKNTSFYHISTLVRRKRNSITAIMSNTGEWVHDELAVKEVIRNGFSDLYTTSHSCSTLMVSAGTAWKAQLSNEERESIDRDVSDDEIKAGLWSLKAFKAPGPDGLHAGFFQRFWLIVGNSVLEEVRKIFAAKEIPEELNRTSITLIPKIPGLETLSNYHPISLCNTMYKVVSKILVARLRPLLGKLISPYQSAFVPGRKGTDNAIIVQELVHTISRKKGRSGFMAIKIDLEKAYDKLEWSFIRDMLIRVNLPQNLIKLMMSCVSTVSTSIVVNGGALDQILPSRGLRQGDPLSPYIFILCMDFLSQLIEEKCSSKSWKPVRASRGGLAFSHLFFADDLVLFAKANQENCVVIRKVLDLFCSRSGQSVSGAKSRVYFSPNVDRARKEELCDILGFQSTPNLGKYLGIPIKHPGSSSQDFNFVLERVKQKLAGWKVNLLSLVGRLILVKHVSSTIPNYVMQSAYLSSKIIEGIDRVNRNFLWGSPDSVRKMHWVGWSKVTKPKEKGGLGLQSAKRRNLALLAKLNWRLQTEGESLWAKVLKGKYCSTRRVTSRNRDKLPCSRVWTAMKKGALIFQKGVRWTCGRESNLNFWFDNWSKFGALRQIIQGPISSELMKLKVKDVVSANGWDWSFTSFEFPDSLRQELQAIPFAMASRREDKLTWKE
ncbi:hypothetical protein SO802_007275 [Lithocarpus litseifolius]|uniref:Reverse transcriptase domain-containing protein n=1 Tax=Lithocarpus litseifolius TaxID=425828 RepID=A0AAW2DQR6_9ROSI